MTRSQYLDHLSGGSPFSAEDLASLYQKDTRVRKLIKKIEDKRRQRYLRFDETEIHPERKTVDPDREQYPCGYLINNEERQSWESQCKISHKVAVMKAIFVEHIVNGTLVDHWCKDTYNDVQIQGAVTNHDEMEFNFEDSRAIWSYASPDRIVDEIITTRTTENGASATCAASSRYEPIHDEYLPELPAALWLMDTGCGHDLVNDKMAEDYPVKTLKKSSRIMFSTANGRVESRNVVPFYCKELAQLVHPYLLHDTPPVLSVGKRCMEQGFTFHWEAGRKPIMTNPEGLVVELEVERNIPH